MTKCSDFPDCEHPTCKCAKDDVARLAVVTKLNDGRPALNDIPARLRLLADGIEAGEYPIVETAIVIMNNGDWPTVLQYGNVDKIETHPLILLQLALSWMTTRVTRRRG